MMNKEFLRQRLAAIVMLLIGLAGCSQPDNTEEGNVPLTSGNGLKCLYSSDFYMVHFTAYQNPEVKKQGVNHALPFCEKLPDTGLTYIVIDIIDKDVREMPVGLKIVEVDTQKTQGKSLVIKNVIQEVPPVTPLTGVVSTEVTFDKPGRYAVYVIIGEDVFSDDDVVKIPFLVGGA